MQSLELVSKEKELECVRESIKLYNSDLELKEKKVESLNNFITVCGKEIDSKSEELGKIQKLIQQQTNELAVMQNQHDSMKLLIRELSKEFFTEEKRHEEILEIICRSSSEMEERAQEIKAAESEASDLSVRSKRVRHEVEGKKKELDLLKNHIELEEKKLFELKIEMEEETYSKKKDLLLINSKIEESGKQLAAVDELVELQRRRLEIQSMELISKDMELECVCESSKRFEFEIDVKEKRVKALDDLIAISSERLDFKSKELGEIQKLIRKQPREVGVMHKQHNSMKLSIRELSELLVAKEKQLKEILEAICRSSSEMESTKTEASNLNIKSQRLRREVEDREKELNWLKNQIKSEENELTRLRKSIQDCKMELSSRRDQVEAMKNTQRELELKKQLIQMSIKHQKQPASAETEPDIEDALTHHENSNFLERDEISSFLRNSPDPAEYVLELVQEEIKEEVDLHESLMANWVLFFEELAKIQRSDETQVELKATQVATLWKRKITTMEAPRSSLEVLAFLLFIVAYGLKELINQEEDALLASSIAQHEHAPTLFNSLGLNVPGMVVDLITKNQYIAAVQLICPFKVNNISPSHLLMKEIIELRRSALENRSPAESSQAKEKDGRRLRAILQLVADYKLEIDLPGDLVANLMVERENINLSVRYHTSSSNPEADSPSVVSAQHSNVNLRVPKLEI